jgi:hypothetical protein
MVGPIWAPGVCLDARVAAKPESKSVILMRFGPSNDAERHNDGNAY